MRLPVTIAVLLALGSARAELPVEQPIEAITNGARGGIVVPAPTRAAGEGTNTTVELTEPKLPPSPNYNPYAHWKLTRPPRVTQDALWLRNNDMVRGRFTGLDEKLLGWEMPEIQGAARFQREGAHRLRFADPTNAPALPPTSWVVRLTNGGVLQGNGLLVTASNVTLHTSQAGPLQMPREMVAAAYHNGGAGAGGFRAIQNIAEWDRIDAGANGGFGMQTAVFRDVGLPEAVLIEFDLANRMNQQFQVHLPVSAPKFMYTEPHVLLQIAGNNATLQTQGENLFLGGDSVQLPRPRGKGWRIGLAFSRSQAKVALLIDGKEVKRMVLPVVFPAQSRGMVVMANEEEVGQDVGSLLLTRINDDLILPATKPEQDIVRLANGDSLTGKLESLDSRTAVCVGAMGRVELPLERVVAAVFAPAGCAQPRRRDADVTVQFTDGGRLTAELRKFAADGVTLGSDAFGQISVPRALVSGIQFGVYAPPPKTTATGYNPNYGYADYTPGRIGLDTDLSLEGYVTGLANGLLGWQHPHSAGPLMFAVTNVVFVNALTNTPTATTNAAPTGVASASVVQLTNGDSLRGELVMLDAQQLQVRTPNTAPLTISRRYVSTVIPNLPAEGVLDSGSVERWALPVTAAARNRGPVSSRQYVRNASLPDRVCMQLDIVGQPGPWTLSAWLFGKTDPKSPMGIGSTYGFSMNGPQLVLQETSPTGGSQPVSVNLPGLMNRSALHLVVLADRSKQEMFVFADGKLVAQRRNFRVKVNGSAIQMTANNANLYQIRDVVLDEWKGTVESVLAATPAGNDVVRRHDWSTVVGQVEGIRDGYVTMTRQPGLLLSKAAMIQFDPGNHVRPRRLKTDVRVTLADGGQLTMTAPALDVRGLVGNIEGIGAVVISPSAVRRLHFQPYEPPKQKQPNRRDRMFFGGGGVWVQ